MDLKRLIISMVISFSPGVIGSFFTISAIDSWYALLNKPFFAPPNWVFAPVWATLYFLIGLSFYWAWTSSRSGRPEILITYAANIALNALWSIVFFGLRSPLAGLFVIIGLWATIPLYQYYVYNTSKKAALIIIPYLIWVSIALALNAGILLMN